MKTKKKFILLISTFILLFSTVYSQNAINKNGSYSNFYDFLNQYFNDPLYQPSNFEGGLDNYLRNTHKLVGGSLHPNGDFSIAAGAIINYTSNFSISSSSYNPNWISLGPHDDTNLPINNQSGVGQIHRLEFDPNYDGLTNQTLYATSGFGGLWKSEDDGLNWVSMNTDTQLPISSVSGIAINPLNPNNIFISTGDGDGGFGLRFTNNSGVPNPVPTVGVYRTFDGGQTWEDINNGLLSNFSLGGIIREIKINPINPDEVILASSSGVIKTNNATSATPTWNVEFTGIGTLTDTEFRGIEYKPNDPSIIYASGTDIYKFDGFTWSSMTGASTGLNFSALPNSFTPVRINIAVTPADPNILYAYIYGTENTNNSKIYVYIYKNNTWTQLYQANGTSSSTVDFKLNWLGIAVSPVNPNEYYFGYTIVSGSEDYLTVPTHNISSYFGSFGIHPDVHVLKFQPNVINPGLFAGTHGGVNFLPAPSDPNPVNRWQRKYKGLAATLIWTFDNSEYDKRKLIGKQDLGFSYLNPINNNWETITGGDGYGARIDDENPDDAYIQGNFAFQKRNLSTNSVIGNEFSLLPIDYFENVKSLTGTTFPMLNHPTSGQLYFGFTELYKRKKRSISSGDTPSDIWQIESDVHKVSGHQAQWQRDVSEFAIATSNTDYIYIVTSGSDNGFNGPLSSWQLNPILLRTTTGGCNGNPLANCFTDITSNLPNIYQGATDYPVITGIAVNPSDEKELWVTFAGYDPTLKVWHSTNAGDTWTNFDPNGVLPNLSVNGIVYQEGTNGILYIGTDVGVYVKEGSANDWEKYGDFPNVRVTELKINSCKGKLDVATYGRGLWQGDLLPSIGIVSSGRIVNSSETWTGNKSVKSNLTIKSGATLTLLNGILNMPKNGKIIIEKGARLIVNGALITNLCGEMWGGIEVRGDMNLSQYVSGAQGVLDILNNSTIENARFAVHTSEHDVNNNYIWGTFGGIVRVRDSHFKNNYHGIDFGPYQNFNPFTNAPANDLSFVNNTTFTWDDNGNMVDLGILPYSHIGMWNSHGIQLRGNKFRNDASITTYSVLDRGRGIVSFDAEFRLDRRCTSLTFPCSSYDNSTFNNLTYGIQAENSNAFNSFVVNYADFVNCLRGAYLKNVDYAEIVNSTFDIAEEFFGSPSYGIYLDNCNGYEIEENNFFTTAGNATYGIYTKASGTTANEIYNNQLNNLQIANQTEGVNGILVGIPNGLVFRCNQNSNTNTADIAVTTGVVNKNQGNCNNDQNPANNLFAGTATNDIWLNSSMPFMDYYHSSGNAQLVPTNNFPFGAVITTDCNTSTFNQSVNCSSRQQVVSNPTGLLANLSTLRIQQQTLTDVIDNGNTKALVDLINSTAPDWQIKNELMAASPYLSEQVLVAMLLKSSALPDWVVQQVLYANVPLTDKVFITMLQRIPALPNHIVHHLALESSPLSNEEQIALIKRVPALPDWVITPVMVENSPLFDEVLIALMERTPTIADWSIRNIFVRNAPLSNEVTEVLDNQGYPNWLINNINNSPFIAGDAIEKPQPLSPLLEQYNEIGVVNHKIQLTENELFRTYLHDTTGTYGLNDVLAYLKQQNHNNDDEATCCAKKLSCALIKNKEHQEAQNTIDSLRQDSTLTDFCDFHTALNDLGQATPGTIDSITNAAITQTIESVANSISAGKEKAGAEALLQFAGLDNFSETFEPLNANLRTKSTDGKPTPGTVELLNPNYKDDLIKVYPNPNNGKFYVEYAIEAMQTGSFILTDLLGKEIFRKPLKNNKGRLDIKEQIIPGIYLYQIIVNGETYSVNKLVINNQ
ncbi:MAG: T9SS type A sorting domain-containing protein [Vicingaceae bacterium]|nr:T9SS type A sorting domain-containing protein [Vicingaceae bacterium]